MRKILYPQFISGMEYLHHLTTKARPSTIHTDKPYHPCTVCGTAVSTEAVLRVSYQPLAVFRVRPVTRCTSTMPGHTEAVLHVSYSPDGSMLASGGGDMTVRLVFVLCL